MTFKTIIVSDGVELTYSDSGSGKPLILIPGWSQSAEEFKFQIEAFSKTRRVIAVDMRGHGRSSKPSRGYRIQRLAKDLHDVIRGLNLYKPDVLGHSMGTSIIWSYLSLFANERDLGHLVFVDEAAAVVGQPNWDEATVINSGRLLPDAAALAGFEAAVLANTEVAGAKEVIRGMFTANIADADLTWIASENLKLPRKYAAELLHDHAQIDWRSQIGAITNKVLVIGGEASIFNPDSQRWIARQIPNAQVTIFAANEGGSHFMFYENPTKFNILVEEFLNS